METPVFFNESVTIVLHDSLAEFLGAAGDGVIEYSYLDAVKLAGHSCPTVAGAYLMTVRALNALYPDSLPERGEIRVEFRESLASGVAGVIANVVSLITGAAQEGGFKGIAGRFERRNKLFFNREIPLEARFTRLDTGAGVDAAYRPERVPSAPEMRESMQKALSMDATAEDKAVFGRLWQDRVKRILIDHADDPELVVLSPVTSFT